MLVLEAVASAASLKVDVLSMSFDDTQKLIYIDIDNAVSAAWNANDVREGAYAGFKGLTPSMRCGAMPTSANALTMFDLGNVVLVGTSKRTAIDLSSVGIDFSAMQASTTFIDCVASSLKLTANDMSVSTSQEGRVVNLDIREGATQPSASAIKTALTAGLACVGAAAKMTALAAGGLDTDAGLLAALLGGGLAKLSAEAVAAAQAAGGVHTEAGLKAAINTTGVVLVTTAPDLAVIVVPGTPTLVSVGGADAAGGACGNATQTQPPPPPQAVPLPAVDTSASVAPTPTPTFVDPRILSCTAVQNSSFPCDDNFLTVCFTTNIGFEPFTLTEEVTGNTGPVTRTNTFYKTIRLAGLRGPNCEHGPMATQHLAITGQDTGSGGDLFHPGDWNPSTGVLNVRLNGEIAANAQVCFGIPLKNPKCSQPGVAVNMSISSDSSFVSATAAAAKGGATYNAAFDEITCTSAGHLDAQGACPAFVQGEDATPHALTNGQTPLLVVAPAIVHTSIKQSSPFPCATNFVTIELSFNVPLLCPCSATGTTAAHQHITIAGLRGSLTESALSADLSASDKLSLTVLSGAASVQSDLAPSNLTQASGLLVLDLGAFGSTYSACTALVLKVKLLNPKTATAAAAVVSVNVPGLVQEGCNSSCNPSCSAPVTFVNPTDIDQAPLYVKQGSIKATMCQSNAWPGTISFKNVSVYWLIYNAYKVLCMQMSANMASTCMCCCTRVCVCSRIWRVPTSRSCAPKPLFSRSLSCSLALSLSL